MIKKFILIAYFSLSIFAIDTTNIWRTSMIATVGTIYATNLFHASEAGASTARDGKVMLNRFDMKWHMKDFSILAPFTLKYYHHVSYGLWQVVGDLGATKNNVVDFNPLFRLQFQNLYIDYSMGYSLMSSDYILDKEFGGKFAFNHILALGINYNKFYLHTSFSHYSNNDIYRPNNGINFLMLSLGYVYK